MLFRSTWYLNDKKIRASRKFEMVSSGKEHSLIISDVSYDEAGNYAVVLDGEAKSSCQFQVVDQTCQIITGLKDAWTQAETQAGDMPPSRRPTYALA